MTINSYVNLDARFLFDLAHEHELGDEDNARLLAIAERIEAMDAKIARHIDGTFVQGKLLAEIRARERSNVLPPARRVTTAEGETLIAALEAKGKSVKRGKPGESGLKPKPIVIDPTKSAPARKGFRLGDL